MVAHDASYTPIVQALPGLPAAGAPARATNPPWRSREPEAGGSAFTLSWPGWQPPAGDGLIVIARQGHTTLGWGDALLARVQDQLYVWTAVKEVGRALEVIGWPGVVAASWTWPAADPRHVNLALQVARRLAANRATGNGGPASACLTASSAPTTVTGWVRVPHLVTVCSGAMAADAVVWELLPIEQFHRWFEAPASVLEFVERHLYQLLRLRMHARTRRLPATPAAAKLLSLLPESGELSIGFVCRNLDLVRVLLRTHRP